MQMIIGGDFDRAPFIPHSLNTDGSVTVESGVERESVKNEEGNLGKAASKKAEGSEGASQRIMI